MAAAVIYPAALAAWSFIAVVSSVSPDYAQWRATRVFFTGLAVLFFYNLKLIIEARIKFPPDPPNKVYRLTSPLCPPKISKSQHPTPPKTPTPLPPRPSNHPPPPH